MFAYATVGVNELAASAAFCDLVMEALGASRCFTSDISLICVIRSATNYPPSLTRPTEFGE